MREIKFRVWSIYSKKMIDDGFYLSLDGDLFENDNLDYKNKSSFEIMQYTGLKDKNGKEIYEGDILKRTVTVIVYGTENPPEDIDEYLHVEYRDEYAGFYIGERPLFAYVDTTRDVDTGCRCTKAEVIGNIYENPELQGA